MELPCRMWQVRASHPPVLTEDAGKPSGSCAGQDNGPTGGRSAHRSTRTGALGSTATKHQSQHAKRKAEQGNASGLGHCRSCYWRIQQNTPVAGNVADALTVMRSEATDRRA